MTDDTTNEGTDAANLVESLWVATPSEAADITAEPDWEALTKEFAPVDRQREMDQTNAGNDEARARAIAEGMDEGTAAIVYPSFSTPEDMDRIN
jgi:phytoene dehydrogenase-like protein